MKYYISKPNISKTDGNIIKGIKEIDKDCEFVESVEESDICVFQKGWTRSAICIAEYHKARELKKQRRESYIYTDKYKAKIN